MKNIWKTYTKDEYQLPPDYFEEFEIHLKNEIKLRELESNSSGGYKVPKHYFKNLTPAQFKPEKRKVFWITPTFKAASWAAVAAILVLVFLVYKPSTTPTNTLENLSSSSLDAYFEDEGIQEYITMEDITKIENSTNFIKATAVSDDIIYDNINKEILEEELEPSLAQN